MYKRFAVLKEKNIKMFILLQVLYAGITGVLNIFMNTFFMKFLGSTSNEILLYNLVMAMVQPFAMITAIKLSTKVAALTVQRFCFIFFSIMCIWLMISGEKVAPYYLVFSVLMSFGSAYYFTIYSRQMISYTKDELRDVISGITTFLGLIVSLALPLLSGFLMTKYGFWGYRIMFAVEALLAVLAIITTTGLKSVRTSDDEKNIGTIEVLKAILGNKQGLKIMIANGIDNGRNFTITFYVTILIYSIISSEMLVSVNSVVGSIAGIVGALFYAVIVSVKNRTKAVYISVVIAVMACIPMIISLSPITLIFFAAVNNLCNTYISSPVLNSYFAYIDTIPLLKGKEAEAHFVRELFIMAGRVLGIALIFLIPQSDMGIVITLIIMVASCAISGMLIETNDYYTHKKGRLL